LGGGAGGTSTNDNIFLKMYSPANGGAFAVVVAAHRTIQRAHKYKLIVVKRARCEACYTLCKMRVSAERKA